MIKPRHYWAPMVYCAFLSTASAGVLDQGTRAAETETNANPACVSIRAEARWQGAGYDHWVKITNGCGSPVACDVSTNVNPDALTVTVQPGQTSEVLTFRGSPARTFTPYVTCQLPKEPPPRIQ